MIAKYDKRNIYFYNREVWQKKIFTFIIAKYGKRNIYFHNSLVWQKKYLLLQSPSMAKI